MLVLLALVAAGEGIAAAAANDPLTAVVAAVITALQGVQTAQMSGLRHDFHTYREAQEKRVQALEERVQELELEREEPPPKKKVRAGSHSTTRGARPKS